MEQRYTAAIVEERCFYHEGPARQSRNQRSTGRTDRRGTEVAEFGVLLHKILFSAYSASPR